MTEPLVRTCGLTKRYGPHEALVDCDLEIPRGEIFGLLGPNGSGKTTLLRLLLGFLRATAGRASVAGLDCHQQSLAVRAEVAYLPGEVRLFPHLRLRQVQELLCGLHPRGQLDQARRLADRLSLDLSRPVAACSTGMRQQLALTAALAIDTPLIILDEPTANLDPTVRGHVLEMLREARATGRTVLFSSHVLAESEAVCDRVVILRRGRVVGGAEMASLARRHRLRARLTGPLPPIPPTLATELEIMNSSDGQIALLTTGELAPLLGWLATLPLREIRIEPVGLGAVYEEYHPAAGP